MRKRLSDDQIRAIRTAYKTPGVTQEMLGRQYGVTGSAIGAIVKGESYASVKDLPEVEHPTRLRDRSEPTVDELLRDVAREVRLLRRAIEGLFSGYASRR